jgi:Uma2 family endonuclease
LSTIIAPTRRKVTPEELLTMPDGKRFELVDGELVERKMGWKSSWVGGRLLYRLSIYCDAHAPGWLAPGDASYQCFPDAPQKVRRPDVSFIRAERLATAEDAEGHCPVAPDLAVEVISRGDLYSQIEEKVDEYLRAGTSLVWVINPKTRTVRVHRRDGSIADVGEHGELDGEGVLPGFRLRVAELFQSPAGDRRAQREER